MLPLAGVAPLPRIRVQMADFVCYSCSRAGNVAGRLQVGVGRCTVPALRGVHSRGSIAGAYLRTLRDLFHLHVRVLQEKEGRPQSRPLHRTSWVFETDEMRPVEKAPQE